MLGVMLALLLVVSINPALHGGMMATGRMAMGQASPVSVNFELEPLTDNVLPAEGIAIPVQWNDLGQRMIRAGAIDAEKFKALYKENGGWDSYADNLLEGQTTEPLLIDGDNARVMLNLFWALGLANSSSVLDQGPMMDQEYGGADRFASTGGWTLAKGDAMEHYSAHSLLKLTPEQTTLVANVAKNIFRPCCNNSTFFPDCNHGMAMLGLLELMASQDVSEDDMYKYALQMNSYWYPDTYLNIGKYLATQGVAWDQAEPSVILSQNYSSGSGYQQVLSQIEPIQSANGSGCAV